MKISLILTGKDLDRFNEKWEVSDTLFFNNTPCHIWTACKNERGYPQFRIKRKTRKAHRISYATFYNINELSSELDHLCRNRACVNPYHLEEVSRRENVVRSRLSKLNENKTSKYTGVHWDSDSNRWMWSLSFNGKVINGRVVSEEEAYHIYKKLIKEIEETGTIKKIPRKIPHPNVGCYYIKKTGRWRVVYRDKHIGVYETIEEARVAYANASASTS
jgi:hypothetical protein